MTVGFSKNDSAKLKGIAILFMLMHHLYFKAGQFEGYAISFAPFSESFVIDVSMMMKICVSFFAFISGFGLHASFQSRDTSCSRWALSRIVKTQMGFLFIFVPSLIVTALIDGLPFRVYFSGSRIAGIVYLIVDALGLSGIFKTPSLLGSWWYMSAAIVFVAILPVLEKAKSSIGWVPLLAIIIFGPRMMNVGFPGSNSVLTFLLPFVLGVLCNDLGLFEWLRGLWNEWTERCPEGALRLGSWILLLLFSALSYLVFLNIKYDVAWELEYGLIPVLFVPLLQATLFNVRIFGLALAFFGKYSMAIFLTHGFIRGVYFKDLIYGTGDFIISFILLLTMSLALAMLLEWLKGLSGFSRIVSYVMSRLEKSMPLRA